MPFSSVHTFNSGSAPKVNSSALPNVQVSAVASFAVLAATAFFVLNLKFVLFLMLSTSVFAAVALFNASVALPSIAVAVESAVLA